MRTNKFYYAFLAAFAVFCASPAKASLEGPGDYVIIYPNVLSAPAAALANYRDTEDTLTPVLAKAEDIYADPRFNGPTPEEELKNYISWAYWNWTPKPKYVVLFGNFNLIPYKLYDYDHSLPPECAYEDWMVLLEGGENDAVPDLALGRIPAMTVAEGNSYVGKIGEYEEVGAPNWSYHALLIREDEDPPVAAGKFWKEFLQKYNDDCKAILPAGFTPHELKGSDYPGNEPSEAAFNDLHAHLAQGRSVVLFQGMTGSAVLSQFISTYEGEVNYYEGLRNVGKYPVFLNISCSTAGSDLTRFESNISRHLTVAASKGAIACVGSTAATYLTEDGHFARDLFFALFYKHPTRLGDAFLHAKGAALGGRNACDTYRSFCLFGDPALKTGIHSEYFPELLGGWPQYMHQDIRGVAVGEFTPPLAEIDGGVPWYPANVPLDIAAVDDVGFDIWSYKGGGSFDIQALTGPEVGPAGADIDGDGRPEVIVCGNNNLYIRRGDFNGFVFYKDYDNERITKAAAVGDVNGDGFLEVAVATTNTAAAGGKLHVYKKNGQEVAGWPKTFNLPPSSPPAVGDVNADGDLEIVITTASEGNSALHVFDKNGDELSGWPKSYIDEGLTPVALADVDGPEDVEIIVASTEVEGVSTAGNIYVYKANGNLHRHYHKANTSFPIRPIVGKFLGGPEHQVIVPDGLGANLTSFVIYKVEDDAVYGSISVANSTISNAPTVANVDADANYELIAPLWGGMMAYNIENDTEVAPWTGGLAGAVCSPLVADVNADGKTDVVVGDGKAVYVMTTNTSYTGFPDLDWPSRQHDNLNTRLYDIAAPTAVSAFDLNNDNTGKLVVAWSPSMDDGFRSRRVANYMVYRRPEGSPTFAHVLTVPAGTMRVVDEGLQNGVTYTYYVVATDTDGTTLGANYHFSQPSAQASAAPE